MKTEIFVTPKYTNLSNFIGQIPYSFNRLGREIHHGRNEIRVINENGVILTAKYFKKITFANRFIYAKFRKSKAQRAYQHSLLLIQKGITSPEPIAYINVYRYGLLNKSYYISLFTNYDPLKKILELPLIESIDALKAFARFSYRLHNLGIFHDDYTIDNILYCFSENGYDFSLIDNNRMRFRKYSYGRGVKNLERLRFSADKMGIIAAEYAKLANENDIRTLSAMSFFRLRYLLKVSLKKGFKNLIQLIIVKPHIPLSNTK